VAEPAWIEPDADDELPLDPHAVGRAYRVERAKRRAREDRLRERKMAALRFVAAVVALLLTFVFLSLTVWQEIQRLFGL
jgi:type VI protein secretion system component VasF